MSIIKKLQDIQSELDGPKNQFTAFGKDHYRSGEDILAAAKPICIKHGCLLTVTDEVVMLGDRFYVKATAKIKIDEKDDPFHIETTAYAREELTKKGMDAAQITGAASSYARKYALNGLFCLDDVKDADHGVADKNGNSTIYDKAVETFNNTPAEDIEITDDDMPDKTDVVKSECEQCQAQMTQGQMTISKKKYDGRVLCPRCQKEAA